MDSRDWLNASEPRSVRPVIKRVLEEITRVDSHAALLYEEGSRKDRSSDSSRRTHYRYFSCKTAKNRVLPTESDGIMCGKASKF